MNPQACLPAQLRLLLQVAHEAPVPELVAGAEQHPQVPAPAGHRGCGCGQGHGDGDTATAFSRAGEPPGFRRHQHHQAIGAGGDDVGGDVAGGGFDHAAVDHQCDRAPGCRRSPERAGIARRDLQYRPSQRRGHAFGIAQHHEAFGIPADGDRAHGL